MHIDFESVETYFNSKDTKCRVNTIRGMELMESNFPEWSPVFRTDFVVSKEEARKYIQCFSDNKFILMYSL